MAALRPDRIAELLQGYCDDPAGDLLDRLSTYLDLLLKWNARTNLTAIRDPEEIVRRHFGESLFTAAHLPVCRTLLDLGSGAGFPGLPIQLARPGLRVTLAESQNKKAAFLREAVRVLQVSTEVWGDRVERMVRERVFDVVTLRAVDNPDAAFGEARRRLAAMGVIAHLTGGPVEGGVVYPMPGSARAHLHLLP
jgi:16S rRNA (guanine527-N7)-methyltransferase